MAGVFPAIDVFAAASMALPAKNRVLQTSRQELTVIKTDE
jgi:hypothetical protein